MIERAKGTRDFAPEEKIFRDEIIEKIKKVFELYSFTPLETPALERYEILASKYAGGAEILKETFKLRDRAGRKLGLRYDLTVPLARFIGMNLQLKMPFKRYQIDKVWRDGPIKTGRYREFWQADVDTVGVESMLADAEILILTTEIFKRLGIDVKIFVNNRKFLDGMLKEIGIKKKKQFAVLTAIDKLDKIGGEEVRKELDKVISKKQTKILFDLLNKSIDKLEKEFVSEEAKEGIKELKELLSCTKKEGVKIFFSPFLVRGLAYYTGPIFEVYTRGMKSSLAAGGRYDRMISLFLGKKRKIPATGISFGIDVIEDVLSKKLEKKTSTKVYVIPIGKIEKAIALAQKLRKEGINTDIDLQGRGPSTSLDYADKLSIPFVVFVGERELKQKKFKLRNMSSGKEEMLTEKKLVKKLKKAA